jgi:hypothetical protein
MKDPWEKAYVYGRGVRGRVAHIIEGRVYPLCWGVPVRHLSRTPDPYPVCKNCLRTKRAKELGLK